MSKPGIASSLSRVPPVWPSPLPLILAKTSPTDASKGPRTKVTVSPTPPVECLSTFDPGTSDKSTVSPESIIAFVR